MAHSGGIAPDAGASSGELAGVFDLHFCDASDSADHRLMKTLFTGLLLQTALILIAAPLVSGLIRSWKAKLQNRRGAPPWQMYLDLAKLLRKDRVVSEHASWVFEAAPWVVFLTSLIAALMIPMIWDRAPLSLFGGALAMVGLLALGRFFLALGGLDPGSAFGGMGSSREMTLSSVAEPALMLAIFTLAIAAGSTSLDAIVRHSIAHKWPLLNPASLLAFAALFIVLLAETGRVPVDNPATHLELTMIHEAMILEHSGPNLALLEYGASIKQFALFALLANLFFPFGIAANGAGVSAVMLAAAVLLVKCLLIAMGVVLVETVNAKLRLFRVPNLLAGAFVLAALALLSTYIFL
jgi:formate hydrogenlyase subunit 4